MEKEFITPMTRQERDNINEVMRMAEVWRVLRGTVESTYTDWGITAVATAEGVVVTSQRSSCGG